MYRGLAAFFLIVLVASLAMGSVAELAEASPAPFYVKLYAHTVPTTLEKVISTLPEWNGQKFADATKENSFLLQGPLGFPITVSGTITFRVWLSADRSTAGTLSVSVYEQSSEGQVQATQASMDGIVFLDTKIREYYLAIGKVTHSFDPLSKILLTLQLATVEPARSILYWDDAKTPTQLVLPVLDHFSVRVATKDPRGDETPYIRSDDPSREITVGIKVNVTDAFGQRDLKQSTIQLQDSDGQFVLQDEPMTYSASDSKQFFAVFEQNATVKQGRYSIVVSTSDVSGNIITSEASFTVAPFFTVTATIQDTQSRPLADASVAISQSGATVWSGATNATGWFTTQLPSSELAGTYVIEIFWHGLKLNFTTRLELPRDSRLLLQAPVYDYSPSIKMLGFPVGNAQTQLYSGDILVGEAVTLTDGTAEYHQLPVGQYKLRITYLFYTYQTTITFTGAKDEIIQVPVPHQDILIILLPLLAVTGSVTAYARKRGKSKTFSAPFRLLRSLLGGDLPIPGTLMIAGPPGSGKTVLLQQLADESLSQNRPCVLITNTEFPSKVRDSMRELGFRLHEHAARNRLIFIDCYSAVAGQQSNEKYSVVSTTDLTGLGMNISSSLNELGKGTDVFMDSFAPLFTAFKTEYILTFLHTIGAKIKGGDGRFCFVMGTSLEKGILERLEEECDVVLETQLIESRGSQSRKLRVKKIRGRKHRGDWIEFGIESNTGIIFRTSDKDLINKSVSKE